MDKRAAKTRVRPRWVVAIVAALSPMSSLGLGLGDITLTSYLNEPLAAEVELLDVQNLRADDIRVRLATQDAFDRLGVERAYFLTSINFEVVVDGGMGKILLTTTKPLLEPYLDFLVETRWPDGRLLREYTVLVDLPSTPTASTPGAALGEPASSKRNVVAASREASVDSPSLVTPASRPDRDYDRDAEIAARPGGRYLVQNNDTLWEIASVAAPDGASIEQTMLATAQMNADAFTGGNINGLKAGYVLELPGERDILMSQREAFTAVAQANEDWRNGVRRSPALRVVADDEMLAADDDPADWEEDRQTTDSVDDDTAVVTEVAASGVNPDPAIEDDEGQELMPSPPDSGGGNSTVAASTELMEIEARLTALSEQVGSLRELVVVKDQQIAALEAQLAEQQAKPASSAAPPVPNAPPQLDAGYPWWLFALGGVALLGIGAVVYTRRIQRPVMVLKRTVPAAELEPSVSRPNELEESLASVAPDTSTLADGERGYGQQLHNDYVEENAVADAVAEADIYVAYGRYQQALNLLEAASKTNPDDPAAPLKMVEIYLKNDRFEEARDTVQRLEGLGDGSAYGGASRMLSDFESTPAAVDLGELADPVDAPLSLDLDLTAESLSASPALDLANDTSEGMLEDIAEDLSSNGAEADMANMQGADFSVDLPDLSDQASEEEVLPSELAEVLGSDVPPPSVEEESEDEGLVYAQEVDPIDTQLDLARAYIDMGDEDGARPVLNDVIASGDLRQQAEARELLVSID